ncbi:MAG: glutamate--tRNA ligase [Acidimicrobiales bacterium]
MTVVVRARFAPSPTGMFHVGSARSALWNYLFARQHGGTFVLRIEDTDEARNEPQWVDGIRSAMRWLELDWDEEYLQSDHADAHRTGALRLRDAGLAYYCDCTADAIAARKSPGSPPGGYDGHCRARALDAGPGRALRFRVPPGRTVIADVVRGTVEFDNDKLGGDFVILKGNGSPIFYLANTIDDIDERITHVLRGEEHLPNTPKNQLLWQALAGDQPPPTWAHLPVLVNEARKKLSKRRDQVALESFRDQGFVMEAMRNYLCLLGWAPKGDREFLGLDEMLAEFRLEDVNSSPAFFDVKKLTAFNEHYLRALPPPAFASAAAPFLAAGPWAPADFDQAVFERLAPLVQPRARTLADVPAMVDFIFLPEPIIDDASWAKAVAANPVAPAILRDAREAYAEVEWRADVLHATAAAIGERHGLALGKAQAPIRVAVTGRTVGPPLFESLEVLGRERTIARLDSAIARVAAGAPA